MLSGKATFSGTETLATTAGCSCLSSAIASLFLPWGFNGFGSSTIERDAVLIALEGSEAFELWLWGIFCCKTCVSTWLVNSGAGLRNMLGPRIWKTTLHPNLTSVFHQAVRLTGHSNREASFWNSQSLSTNIVLSKNIKNFPSFFSSPPKQLAHIGDGWCNGRIAWPFTPRGIVRAWVMCQHCDTKT